MISRKVEERNEKIIRGLMKLPPNRRCINCNSLGPQYVCTNFWTFVCMTCSGIHREFTHRVKSVSMAKFTSQEVEALQNGGNQRAREIYLKDWDFQSHRFPDSSKVDKIREFIRNVYVDRRYAVGKNFDKPPRDVQNPRIHGDDTRRASSYHSYSQSPPYDYQYEDRRYGKQAVMLTRKPGSDRGRYEGKMSDYIGSPGGFNDPACDDRFANDASSARVSDYSDVQSPDFHKDTRFCSSSNHVSRASSSEDIWMQTRNRPFLPNAKRDLDGIPRSQRTASSCSFGSMDSNSLSFKSCNSGGLVDFFCEPEQASETLQDKVSSFSQPGPVRSVSLDFSKAPVVPGSISSPSPSVDLFQLQSSSQTSSVDLFPLSVAPPAQFMSANHPPETSKPPKVDFFADIPQQHSTATLDEKSMELSVSQNEGWATFDMPQATSSTAHTENPVTAPTCGRSLVEKLDLFSSLNASTHCPPFETSAVHGLPVIPDSWQDGLDKNQNLVLTKNTQPWSAFEESGGYIPVDATDQGLNLHNLSINDGYCLRAPEDANEGGIQSSGVDDCFSNVNVPSYVVSGSSDSSSVLPLMEETLPHTMNQKSNNPFDIPFDSESEQSNMFLDMGSLQASLPIAQLASTFDDVDPWFAQNPMRPFLPSAGQGGLTYMPAQSPSSQIPNVQTQETVASIGGNPFA